MLKGVAGLNQTGAGRTNGQTFNLRGYDKSGVLVLVDGVRQLSDMAKAVALIWIRLLSNVSKLSAGQTPVCTRQWRAGRCSGLQNCRCSRFPSPETNGLSLWGNIASGDHSTGSGAPGSVKPEKQMRSFLSLCVKEVISIKVMVSAHLTRKTCSPVCERLCRYNRQ